MAQAAIAARAFRFYKGLVAPVVPRGIAILNPYRDARVRACLRQFLERFYADARPRVLVLGINPGRFGAGITGVTFTDPVALSDGCGIETHLPRRRELSSEFVYALIDRMGGVASFFGRFLLGAVCPLGFTRGGANLNYYDDPRLARAATPFIVEALRRQLEVAGRRDRAVILGLRNLRFVEKLNSEHRFFDSLHGLEHPRFIMQYRRRRLEEHLKRYAAVLSSVE